MPFRNLKRGMDHSFGNLDIEGWNWVDAVNAGADPTGTNSSTAALQGALDDNTLVILPPGTYLLDGGVSVEGLSNCGLVGMGDAAITTPSTYSGRCFTFGSNSNPVDKFVVKNVRFDFTTAEGGMPIEIIADRRFVAEDVLVEGQLQNTAVGENGGRFALKSPDGVGRVTRYRLPDGGDGSFRLHGIAVTDGVSTGGHIRFEDCQVENFSDNGLYCSATGTRVLVDGGRFGNNAVSSIRFHSTDPSIVRGAYVHGSNTAVPQPRGVWLRAGGSHRIESATFDYSPGMSSGPIEIGGDMTASPLIQGVRANAGTHQFFGQLAGAPTTTIRDCRVTGSGDTNTAAIPVTTGRVTIDNVSMDFDATATATTRTGIRLDSPGSVVRNCSIDTTRQALWIRGNNSTVAGNTFSSKNDTALVIEGADTRVHNTSYSSLSDTGTRTRYNGLVTASGAATTPTAANYDRGEVVQWTDTGTGTTTVQMLMPDGSTWVQLD